MRVAFISKAMTAAAYRGRIDALAELIDVNLVIPERWGSTPVEAGASHEAITRLPVLLDGHNHLHLYRGASALLQRLQPGLVHVDEEPYSAVTLQLAAICRRLRVPFVFFAWQNLPKRLPPPFGALRARVFRRAAGGIAGTPAAARVLRAAGFSGPLAVIPQMGVDPVRFRADADARATVRASLGAGAGHFLVGFGGRLVPEKGVDLLLRAAAPLPHTRVLLLGDGPERARLEALALALDSSERVHFAGHVGSLEIARWLPALDALVLPSLTRRNWSEQFGRILVEAMACGVPVVGARSGEIPHVIGDAGSLFPEGDQHALAAALRSLADEPERRRALARAGRERVLAHFTHAAVAEATAAFYRQLLPLEAARGSLPKPAARSA